MSKLETKIEAGTEKYALLKLLGSIIQFLLLFFRSITAMVASLSQILSTQKKTDYKPDEPGIPQMSSVSF